jgi:hypothetical protein
MFFNLIFTFIEYIIMKEHARVGKLTVLNGKPPPLLMRVCFSGGPTRT